MPHRDSSLSVYKDGVCLHSSWYGLEFAHRYAQLLQLGINLRMWLEARPVVVRVLQCCIPLSSACMQRALFVIVRLVEVRAMTSACSRRPDTGAVQLVCHARCMGACASAPGTAGDRHGGARAAAAERGAHVRATPDPKQGARARQCASGVVQDSTNGVSRRAVVARSPFLQQLVQACELSFGQPMATALQQVARESGAFLAQQRSAADREVLQVAVQACSSCLDRTFEPVVAHVERVLSNAATTTSSPASRPAAAAEWGSVTAAGVLQALEAAAQAVRPGEPGAGGGLGSLGRATLPAAEILVQLWQLCSQQSVAPVEPRMFHVPALDQLAAMLGIAWFRKVTLSTQVGVRLAGCTCVLSKWLHVHPSGACKRGAARACAPAPWCPRCTPLPCAHTLPPQAELDARAASLGQLLARLQWKEPHLACCLLPMSAAMMMAVQQAAQKGAIRVDFTVRR